LVDRGRVSGNFEKGAVPFLRENSNRKEVVVEIGVDLVAHGLKLGAGRSSPEFQCQDLVGKGVHNVVDPFQQLARSRGKVVDPVTWLSLGAKKVESPGNVL